VPKISVEKHRYQTLAMMIVENWAVEDISEAMRLDQKDVLRFAQGKGPEGFNNVLNAYREKINTQVVQRKFRFSEMAEQAYSRIENSLRSTNEVLATDTAWKVLQQVSPEVKEPGVSVDVNLTSNHTVNQQVMELGGNLLGMFAQLKKAPGPSFSKHLKIGREALPPAVRDALEAGNGDDRSYDEDPDAVEIVDVPEGSPAPEDS